MINEDTQQAFASAGDGHFATLRIEEKGRLMRLLPKRASVFPAIVLMLFMFALPQAAHAQQGYTAPNPGTCGNNTQNGLTSAAQVRTMANILVSKNTPYLDLKLMYCFQTIMNAFTAISAFSDPLHLVGALIMLLASTILNQVCQDVLSVITQVKTYLLSLGNLLCLPLPSSMIGGINLGLKPITCNGISLVNMSAMSGSGVIPPGQYSFFGAPVGQ